MLPPMSRKSGCVSALPVPSLSLSTSAAQLLWLEAPGARRGRKLVLKSALKSGLLLPETPFAAGCSVFALFTASLIYKNKTVYCSKRCSLKQDARKAKQIICEEML